MSTLRIAVLSLALLLGAGALALAPSALLAQDEEPAGVDVEELMKPGPLPELAVGPADAKVTVVEYYSMTCGHCGKFANEVYPEIKKKYIDTGKIRFIFREYPHNNRAYAASMLARCAGGDSTDKTVAMIEGLFATQMEWATKPDNPSFKTALLDIAKQSGFTQESFEKCLSDQALLDKIAAGHARATDKLGVTSIPTIYVNGKKLREPTFAAFEKMVEPLLPKS